MKKIGVTAGLVLAAAAVVGVFYFWHAPIADNGGIPANNGPRPSGMTHDVLMKNNEFVPKELMIKAGDTVTFINEDDEDHWPASDLHPTHLICPGFDSLTILKKGESYSFTFEEQQICPMHDHILPSMRGKIIIK